MAHWHVDLTIRHHVDAPSAHEAEQLAMDTLDGNGVVTDIHVWYADPKPDTPELGGRPEVESVEPPFPGAPVRYGPHSRACGILTHEHGPACSIDCPTCTYNRGEPVADHVREKIEAANQ